MLSLSDHAAIELDLKVKALEAVQKSKIARLDPSLLENEAIKTSSISEFEELQSQAGESWNPHSKLEYSKMFIRTVVEKAQADRKKKETGEEDEFNEELNLAISALEDPCITGNAGEKLIQLVEELRIKKVE